MDSKHTPGPWTLYDDRDDQKTGRMEIAARGRTIARLFNPVGDGDETLGNGLIMTAAPDLLEALEEIVESYPQWKLSAARAAIAKARGTA